MSDRYQVVNTIRTIEPLLENGWHITRASQAQYRRVSKGEHGYHIVALSREDLVYNDMQVEALFCNSHNGSKKYEIKLGCYRLVCSNGIITTEAGFDEVSIKHLYVPEVIEDRSAQIIERAPKIVSKIGEWSEFQLSDKAYFTFAQHALALRFPTHAKSGDDFPLTVEQLSQVRRPEDMGNDLWRVFNRVQENIIKGGIVGVTRHGGKRLTSKVQSIHRNVEVNQGLWAAAEAIAAGDQNFFSKN